MRCRSVAVSVVAAALFVPPLRAQVPRAEDGIVRGPLDRRQLALVFTGHEFAESAETILDGLGRAHALLSVGRAQGDARVAGGVRR